jgi:peptidoglycan hydrolase-like protein with peptidoglycan-binding domain
MVKTYSRQGMTASRYLLVAAMTGLLVGCGGSSGDDVPLGEQDADGDLILNQDDDDADGDGILDINDSFVDLNGDGLDDITLLTEEEITPPAEFTAVSAANPCGSENGTDNASVNNAWNDNCVIKRSLKGGQFADSLFSVGIQRVLFCSGFGSGTDYRVFADGEYGPGSETAAIAFQNAEGLTADGIVGPQTWASLQNRIELLDTGIIGSTPDTYGFTTGQCADVPMFYQETTLADDGLGVVRGGWTLARNQPNEEQSVPFSYEEAFGRL